MAFEGRHIGWPRQSYWTIDEEGESSVDQQRTEPRQKRSNVRNQHYVPRCLMNAFAKRGGGKKFQVQCLINGQTDLS